jgi:hypothetical protein
LNNQNSSRIVRRMKRTSLFVAAMLVLGALPAAAQTNETGFVVGGSRLFVDGANREQGVEFSDATFSFSNTVFELFWAHKLDEDTWLRLKAGRIESIVPMSYRVEGSPTLFRQDVDGEVQHVDLNVEYRFSEAYGQTAIFAGAGLYRQSADGFDTQSNYGFNFGINADFPITRRYGFVLESAYHFTRADFQPRYLTLGGGLRVSF